MDKVQFQAIVDPVSAAFKFSGNKTGGKLILAFDETQLPQVLRALLMTEQLLTVTIEPEDDFSD